ncbi:MAG TPA: hypothetical protein VHB79_30675 [Polyangiaceae bacterium]|nr:hypothetical protein [Polyangiaceae bacterium]
MTLCSIAPSEHSFAAFGSGEDQCVFTSDSERLAILVLDRQEQQKDQQRQELTSARADYRDALDGEVQALRDAADATFRGALVQSAIAAAAGAASVVSACSGGETAQWSGATSKALGGLAEPIGKLAGFSYASADAKAQQGLQETAKWHLEDARDSLKDSNAAQDKTLDWLGSMNERDAATTTAILSNKV